MGSSRVGRVQTHHSAEEEDRAVVHSVRKRNLFSPETEDAALCVRQSILFGWESLKVENFDGERDREILLWDGELDGVNKELGERTGGFLFL